jgi:hypothetical protein
MGVLAPDARRAVEAVPGARGWLAGVAAVLALATGCYSPSLRDCTVSCASENDCAGGQVCGSDKLCAAPDIAGKCGMAMPGPDAEVPPVDAAVDAAIDAAPVAMVSLRVQITGKGDVVVTGVGTCPSDGPQKGDCTFSVPANVQRMARATGKMGDKFKRWSSIVCGLQGETCTFTPLVTTSIAVQFDKGNPAQGTP